VICGATLCVPATVTARSRKACDLTTEEGHAW
jgi:hypothetical protein